MRSAFLISTTTALHSKLQQMAVVSLLDSLKTPGDNFATAQGVYIEATAGLKGLEINRGRVILSYSTLTGGTDLANAVSIPTDVAVFMVGDNSLAGRTTASLPATGENGQIIIIGTNDANGATVYGAVVTPFSINLNETYRFVRMGGVWKTQ